VDGTLVAGTQPRGTSHTPKCLADFRVNPDSLALRRLAVEGPFRKKVVTTGGRDEQERRENTMASGGHGFGDLFTLLVCEGSIRQCSLSNLYSFLEGDNPWRTS
jgi:hypothetical protein